MRTGEHDWQVVLLVELHHGVGGVVRGVIHQDDVMLPPVPVPIVHHPDKVAEEELHDLGV